MYFSKLCSKFFCVCSKTEGFLLIYENDLKNALIYSSSKADRAICEFISVNNSFKLILFKWGCFVAALECSRMLNENQKMLLEHLNFYYYLECI